jgi:hypothetical protein
MKHDDTVATLSGSLNARLRPTHRHVKTKAVVDTIDRHHEAIANAGLKKQAQNTAPATPA